MKISHTNSQPLHGKSVFFCKHQFARLPKVEKLDHCNTVNIYKSTKKTVKPFLSGRHCDVFALYFLK